MVTGFTTRLRESGMSARESATKGELFETLIRDQRSRHEGEQIPSCAIFVPGRLEVAGKHTDYAGGRSLVCAIERGICLVAAPRPDTEVHIVDVGRKSETQFLLDPNAEAGGEHWSKYALTVARRMTRDFSEVRRGADIVFASDLPRASGMSSSSALIVSVFFALAEINTIWESDSYRRNIRNREDLAGYLASVESGADFGSFSGNRGVGTLGGSEDHVAILCSRPNYLRQYSYCPIRFEREIRMPKPYTFVIGVSGVKADKTGNARESYNRAALAVRKILELWRSSTGPDEDSLAAALASEPAAANRLQEILRNSRNAEFAADFLLNRLAQFQEESNEIVPGVADALSRSDIETAGKLVDRSQKLAELLLGNQTPETVELARSARATGAVAASAFGAGFGGSVWAMVPSARAEGFCDAWARKYRQSYPERAEASQFLISGAGPGLIQLSL
jgi:galactokinase